MDSWEIGAFGDASRLVDDRHSSSNVRFLAPISSALTDLRRLVETLCMGSPLTNSPTSDVPLAHSHKVSQHKVWRKRGTMARAIRTPSASKGGISIQDALAVEVEADALIHGPCLVAQPVVSEWRNHRLLEKEIQTKLLRETTQNETIQI